MGLFNFLKQNKDGTYIEVFQDYANIKNQLTEYYIQTACEKIAKTISRLGFIVINDNENEKKKIEYMLNVSPNANQNSTNFWYNVILKMLQDPDGALIIDTKDQGYFLADSYQVNNQVLNPVTYSNVTISLNGNTVNMRARYNAKDVLHLQYSNEKIRFLRDRNAQNIASAYVVALNGFKAKAPKVNVRVDGGYKMQDANGNVISTNEYVKNVAKAMSKDEILGILTQDGIDIDMIDMKSSLSADDVEKLRQIVIKDIAYAFDIPLKTMMNEFDKESDTEFITYACLPIKSIIEDEINFAWVGKENYMKGKRVIIDSRVVRHVDLIDSANNLDKMFMNGFTFNYIMDSCDYPPINEEWANTPRFTKNYATEEQLRSEYLESTKGGE